jgi:hypothetical protein
MLSFSSGPLNYVFGCVINKEQLIRFSLKWFLGYAIRSYSRLVLQIFYINDGAMTIAQSYEVGGQSPTKMLYHLSVII